MNVSVVLRVKNGEALIARQLQCLACQDYDGQWEVVVVDNGSTDRTIQIAAAWADRLPMRIVDASDARGAAAVANAAVLATQAPVVLTCDHDDMVGVSWVRAMVDALSDGGLAGGNTALVPEPLASDTPESYPGVLPVHRGFLPFTFLCNMGVRRELFDELSGFDPMMNGAEDVDFCWRAQLGGAFLRFAPDATVLKARRDTPRSRLRQHRAFGRGDVALDRRYRQYGLGSVYRPTVRQAAWLMIRAPRSARDRQFRADWAAVAGHVVGVVSAVCRITSDDVPQ